MSEFDLIQAGNLFNTAVGGITQQIANQRANRLSYEQEVALMGLSNKYNVENWLMQAAYNSPTNQMMRLRNAGLNPNLVYGSGATATMNNGVSGAPSGHAPQYRSVDFMTLNLMANQMLLTQAQRAKTEQETRGVNLSNDILEQDLKLKEMDVRRRQASNPTQMGYNDLEQSSQNILKTKSDIERNSYINALNDAQTTFQNIENTLKNKYGDVEYGLKVTNQSLQVQLNQLEVDNFGVKLKAFLRLNDAQVQQAKASAASAMALREKYLEETELVRLQENTERRKSDLIFWQEQQEKEKVLQEEYKTGLLNIEQEFKAEFTQEQIENLKSSTFRNYLFFLK